MTTDGPTSAPRAFKNFKELEDIIVFSRNFEEHLRRLELVFGRLQKSELKRKRSNCNFSQKRTHFSRQTISEKGKSNFEVDEEKVKVVEKLK